MARDSRDPKGYYALLNLSPNASEAEVRLAYTFLKIAWGMNRKLNRAKIKEAYDCLSDADRCLEYRTAGKKKRGSPGNRVYVFGGSLALVLFLVGAFVFPGFLIPAADPFRSGDRLLHAGDMAPLGEVVRMEAGHRFANGLAGNAYLIRMEDGTERWFPTIDLERHYQKR